jgi:hypothetical protein
MLISLPVPKRNSGVEYGQQRPAKRKRCFWWYQKGTARKNYTHSCGHRKCGEWLAENVKQGNEKGSNQRDVVKSKDITLQNIGVNKNESSRLQKIAAIPENKFERILQESEAENR